MLTTQIESIGLGFFMGKDRTGDFGHNGADEGFQALLVMNADTGDGYAAMANSDFGIAVAAEYLRSVAKEYAWKNQPQARDAGGELMLVARLADLMQRWRDTQKWRKSTRSINLTSN